MIGLNGELSTVPLPVEPGKKIKVYLGGEGIDQVPGSSIVVSSPYFTVDPGSLASEQVGTAFPVVSVDVSVLPNAPFGDYTIKLQSTTGEMAFVPGALTIDPGVVSSASNPLDDYRFFIAQHYADLTGREADQSTIDKLTAQFTQCGSRADCLRTRRLELSTTLLTQNELPTAGVFLHGLYTAALGRRPRFVEFENDRNAIVSHSAEVEAGRLALALNFVQRPEFQKRYPESMKAAEFVDQLLAGMSVDVKVEREALLVMFDGTISSRAAIVAKAVANQAFVDAQYNQAFVMTQYFSYLRRDPDETGLNFWVGVLKNKPLRDQEAARSMVCAFLNSTEYQNRFGMVTTHGIVECN